MLWPGEETEITPPKGHIVMQLSSTAGNPLIMTLEAVIQHDVPGTQGNLVILHTPNEGIFTIGAASAMLAMGLPHPFTLEGKTLRDAFVEPIGHFKLAPSVTNFAIFHLHLMTITFKQFPSKI